LASLSEISSQVLEGFKLLREAGDSPDAAGRAGVWASARDRDLWLRLAEEAKTVGSAALALYLVGDRALHTMYGLTQVRAGESGTGMGKQRRRDREAGRQGRDPSRH
jgi:hypothetical protein